jgi:hypothetical protein
MNFLPEDYTAPKTSNYYLKLQEGENRVRILSQPIIGWEDWHDKKPVRYKMNEKPDRSFDPKKPIKHFWAFIVFNYNVEEIQIMHVTQATIRKNIEALCKDKDWGAPYGYDIKVMKTGEGVDTEYSVNPVPHKPVEEYILKCFKDRPCNLEAIFFNEDPFSREWKTFTKLGTEADFKTKEEPITISKDKALELEVLLHECDPKYRESILSGLKKLPTPINKLEELSPQLFEKIKFAAIKKKEEYQKTQENFLLMDEAANDS